MTATRGRFGRIAGPSAIATLVVAGLVLGVSWAVDFPDVILLGAWLVVCVAAVVVVVAAWRDSRAQGMGYFRAIGRMVGDLGRFAFHFF